jgi:hypothetical protein
MSITLSFLTVDPRGIHLGKDALSKEKPDMSIRHYDRTQKGARFATL